MSDQRNRGWRLIAAAALSAIIARALWPDVHLYASATMLGGGLMLLMEARRGQGRGLGSSERIKGWFEWHSERRRILRTLRAQRRL